MQISLSLWESGRLVSSCWVVWGSHIISMLLAFRSFWIYVRGRRICAVCLPVLPQGGESMGSEFWLKDCEASLILMSHMSVVTVVNGAFTCKRSRLGCLASEPLWVPNTPGNVCLATITSTYCSHSRSLVSLQIRLVASANLLGGVGSIVRRSLVWKLADLVVS